MSIPQLLEVILVPRGGRALRPAAVARLASGGIFVLFGGGKFVSHATETASFDRYGLPSPGTFAYVIGILEVGGGLLLLLGFAVRPTALVLAGNMVGAISTAGRVDGGVINLGLAPALLLTMLALAWTGAGERSLDGRLATGRVSHGRPLRPPARSSLKEVEPRKRKLS
jgi:putative oxidoreductase